MKTTIARLLLGVMLCCSAAFLSAQSSMSQDQASPDNTKVNTRDRDSASPTADRQKENATDRKLTQQIRRALIKDASLSTYGHNLKIISQDGVVTLKGPVKSQQEKDAIEAKAAQIAGADKVKSEIEIASK